MERISQSRHLKAAAGTAGSVCFVPPRSGVKWKALVVTLTPNADSATNGSNYGSIRVYAGTGTSTPLTAARNTASTSLTAYTPEAMAITGAALSCEITQANPLHVDLTHTGTGVAVDVHIDVEFEALS